jgi:hypothetical protein
MGYTLSLFRKANEKQHQLQNENHKHVSQAHKDGNHLYHHCIEEFHDYEQTARLFANEITDEKDFHRYEQMEMKVRLLNGGTAFCRTNAPHDAVNYTTTGSSAVEDAGSAKQHSSRASTPTTRSSNPASFSPRPGSPSTITNAPLPKPPIGKSVILRAKQDRCYRIYIPYAP